jgi:hypothetical protein
MTKQISNHQITLVAGTLPVFPAGYFVLAAFVNYGLGFSPLWVLTGSIFEKPANRHPGWNINPLNLLARCWHLFGIFSPLHKLNGPKKERLQLNFGIRKHWLNIAGALVCI